MTVNNLPMSWQVQALFQAHSQFATLYLPPYSTFLNLIEEFLSTWRWKVCDWRPHEQAVDDACNDITADVTKDNIASVDVRMSFACATEGGSHCLSLSYWKSNGPGWYIIDYIF